MKPPVFDYARPATLSEAVQVLSDGGDGAKVLAGGQSLVPMLNFRLAQPSLLVDISAVPELSILEERGDTVAVGAFVRQRAAETSSTVNAVCPLLAQALQHVGHLQIRTRGTIGGSIAHADPAAEMPAVAVVLDAAIVAQGPSGERLIPAGAFFFGPYMTNLQEDEIVTRIDFPILVDHRSLFVEYARRHGDFALAGVAFALRFERDSRVVAEARIAATGVGPTPTRLLETEAHLEGRELADDVVATAEALAATEVDPPSYGKADGEYRKELLGVLVSRGLRELAQ